jgi:hypothetical protein
MSFTPLSFFQPVGLLNCARSVEYRFGKGKWMEVQNGPEKIQPGRSADYDSSSEAREEVAGDASEAPRLKLGLRSFPLRQESDGF